MMNGVSSRGAIVGVSDHYGWAALITATADGTLVDRRRVELVDEGLTKHPYHHEAQALPLNEALELVERVRLSADRCATRALQTIASTVSLPILGLAMRECPRLPPTVAERIRNYRAQNVADSVMYRHALAKAADASGWTVHWYNPKRVFDAAQDALHIKDFDAHFVQLRKSIGPPWGKDQRMAMAAAIVAAHTSRSG